MSAVFFRIIEAKDKAFDLQRAIADDASPLRFQVTPKSFETVPRSPFAYWASERARQIFRDIPRLQSNGRAAKQGLATADDFRFVRLWTEVPPTVETGDWFSFAKGGAFSSFYSDVHLMVNWGANGAVLKALPGSGDNIGSFRNVGGLTSRPGRVQNTEYYFRPGLTWPRRTQAGLSLRVLPRGCIFADKGPAVFLEADNPMELLALLAITNSRPFAALVELQMAFGSYEVGVLQNTPVPLIESRQCKRLASLARRAWSLKRSVDTQTETSHAFVLPALLQVRAETLAARGGVWAERLAKIDTRLADIQREINEICSDLYGLPDEYDTETRHWFGSATTAKLDAKSLVASLLSWVVGVCFGRFDLRCASCDRSTRSEPGTFDPLPVCAPGMLLGANGLPLDRPPADYAVEFTGDGILVDDAGAASDLPEAARRVFEPIFVDSGARWDEAVDILGERDADLRGWFARVFFNQHIKRYSGSRRKAPIYWQLATPKASYSAWLYYHRLSRDTLFRLLNDHVVPKLQHEEGKLTSLIQEAGTNPNARQRREIDQQDRFVSELRGFRDEVARVAPLWNPNLSDGVMINFAPLWRLVLQSRSWQRECKKVWDKLAAGHYDWTHLAMHLWPERVIRRCAGDRSLAIAHNLEGVLWKEDNNGKWVPRGMSDAVIDCLIQERTSTAVKSAVDDLLGTSAPSTSSVRISRRRRAQSG